MVGGRRQTGEMLLTAVVPASLISLALREQGISVLFDLFLSMASQGEGVLVYREHRVFLLSFPNLQEGASFRTKLGTSQGR